MNPTKRRLSELSPRAGNPRERDPEGYRALMDSIQEHGVEDGGACALQPVIYLAGEDAIIAGSQRWAAAKDSGFEYIWGIAIDLDSEEEINELRVRLNVSAGRWDLTSLLEQFEMDRLLDMGVDVDDLEVPTFEDETASGEGDDDEPDNAGEQAAKWDTQRGQIWEIRGQSGGHLLMIGDSQSAEREAVLSGRSPDLQIVDPPFEMAYDGWEIEPSVTVLMVWGRGVRRVEWEPRLPDLGFEGFDELIFTGGFRGAATDSAAVVFHHSVHMWRKTRNPLDLSVLAKGGAEILPDGRLRSVQKGGGGRSGWGGFAFTKSDLSMAVGMAYVPEGAVVWDPCAGSGSSLLAADRHARSWVGMELDGAAAGLLLERATREGMRCKLSSTN